MFLSCVTGQHGYPVLDWFVPDGVVAHGKAERRFGPVYCDGRVVDRFSVDVEGRWGRQVCAALRGRRLRAVTRQGARRPHRRLTLRLVREGRHAHFIPSVHVCRITRTSYWYAWIWEAAWCSNRNPTKGAQRRRFQFRNGNNDSTTSALMIIILIIFLPILLLSDWLKGFQKISYPGQITEVICRLSPSCCKLLTDQRLSKW